MSAGVQVLWQVEGYIFVCVFHMCHLSESLAFLLMSRTPKQNGTRGTSDTVGVIETPRGRETSLFLDGRVAEEEEKEEERRIVQTVMFRWTCRTRNEPMLDQFVLSPVCSPYLQISRQGSRPSDWACHKRAHPPLPLG